MRLASIQFLLEVRHRIHTQQSGQTLPGPTQLQDLQQATGPLYLHCISGRGRAPTAAAAVLLARGTVRDVSSAIELVKKGRPATSLTGTDVAFLERVAPRLASH